MDEPSPGKVHSLETVRMALYCRDKCPLCRRARAKGGIALLLVKLVERSLCPQCRAYEEVFGRPAHQAPPAPIPRERKYSTRGR